MLRAKIGDSHAVLFSERIRYLLEKIMEQIALCRTLIMKEESPEYTCEHVNRALDFTGEISGKIDSEEVLGRIFSRFCIGK